ncbi:F-box [Hyphodiscus hymeniophilus]|uniref:F-box n=1 Tax=Hyphodiscus hymeniophilus TaxID=353542 RepID=A0A9P6VHA7_9HELO|nr:F-box [Hyphodiscus hymeniophilus]
MSQPRPSYPEASLVNLPVEIKNNIIQHLPQSALRALLLTHTAFVEVAAIRLYMAPHFASTYRYAQFAHIVSHKVQYAELVRDLDLSYFHEENLDDEGGFLPCAGWREFKYRENVDYYFSILQPRNRDSRGSNHPPPSTSLKSFSKTRDISIGGLTHVLAVCRKLRKLDLTSLKLASDFLIASPYDTNHSHAIEHEIYKANSTSGLLFVSDVPNSWSWSSTELQPLYLDFIISHLVQLEHLETFNARNALWVTKQRVKRILGMVPGEQGCPALKQADFRDAGIMEKNACWARKGTADELRGLCRVQYI